MTMILKCTWSVITGKVYFFIKRKRVIRMKKMTNKEIRKLTVTDVTKDIDYTKLIHEIQKYYSTNCSDKYNKYNIIFDDNYLYIIINEIASNYLGKLKQSTLPQTNSLTDFLNDNPSVEQFVMKEFKSKIDYEILYLIFHGRLKNIEPVLSDINIESIKTKYKNIFSRIAEETENQILNNIILSEDMKRFLPSLIYSTIDICLSVYKDDSYTDILIKYLYAETVTTIAMMKFLS